MNFRVKDLYSFAVYKCGISPEYVLYEMGFQEIDYLWESYYSEYREDWEKVRKIAHTTYLSIGVKNPDTAEKFMPFPWDDEKDKSHKVKEANASQEDIKRIKESFK